MARTTPSIVDGVLIYAMGGRETAIPVGSEAWWRWLADERVTTFRYVVAEASYTVRRDPKHQAGYWYAYRRQAGVLHKLYLGKSEDLRIESLDAAAQLLANPVATDRQPARRFKQESFEAELLLTMKLAPPPHLAIHVSRPRLLQQLQQAANHGLTLVSAAAGFGKTTLLSEWRHRSPWPVAWLALDAGDNDPIRFWSCVIAAFDRLHVGAGRDAQVLIHKHPTPATETVLSVLLIALSRASSDMALVLDDYHLITADAIHSAMTFLLERLPPHVHLIIASRTDPPLPLARLRVRGQMTELRASDLRFLPDEAAEFFTAAMGHALPEDAVASLATRTEGWIAGLKLAALALKGRSDVVGFVSNFTGNHRHVVDYLAGEVLRRQPEAIRHFLLQTSILQRMSGALCNALTGHADGQRLLEQLDQANLFLVPLDEERRWYRYHHFFADFLREQLRQTTPEAFPALHSRAAAWYQGQHMTPEAIYHHLAAQSWAQAADLMEGIAWTMMVRYGERSTVESWLQALPPMIVHARPRLCIVQAWLSAAVNDHTAMDRWLQEAEQLIPDEGAIVVVLRSELALVRASAAKRAADAPKLAALAQQVLADLPVEMVALRSIAALDLGLAYMIAGDVAAAAPAFMQAIETGQAAGHLRMTLIAMNDLAYSQFLQGQLRRAAETYQRAVDFAEEQAGQPAPAHGPRPVTNSGMEYVGFGELLRERNELHRALRYVQRGMEIAWDNENTAVLLAGYIEWSLVQQALGDHPSALSIIQEGVERTYSSHTGLIELKAQVRATQARIWLAQNQLDQAVNWVIAASLPLDASASRLVVGYYEYVTVARVLLADGRLAEAIPLLQRLHQAMAGAGQQGPVIELEALLALGLHAHGDAEAALKTLDDALTRAAPEGYCRTFIDCGPTMEVLLRTVLRDMRSESPLYRYTQQLLAVFSQPTPSERQPPARHTMSHIQSVALDEPLSEREKEVLHLLAAGQSNSDIAQTLVLALSTVKWYVKHIYGKLEVHTRTQAVVRAQALGLLENDAPVWKTQQKRL